MHFVVGQEAGCRSAHRPVAQHYYQIVARTFAYQLLQGLQVLAFAHQNQHHPIRDAGVRPGERETAPFPDTYH